MINVMKMKNLLYLLIFTLVFSACGSQKEAVDRTTAPVPGPAPEVQLGDYETFKLENGLTVIVVENKKLPQISAQLLVDVDPVLEGDNAGYVSMTGDLLRAGTTTKSKSEIDEEVDFIGATLSTYMNGIYASSLKKHQDKLFSLMSDVLLNPTFPEDELEKLITRTKSGLVSEKDDPAAISRNISRMVLYGKNHPYGERATEETVENITVQDVKNYYNNYYKPNESYLVLVGDITEEEAKSLTQKYFGSWQKGEVPEHNYTMPKAPQKTQVVVVDKPGAVQSVVAVTYPVDLKPGSPDAIKASVMNSILGGAGFSGRLMQNLRETKAYTYSSRSSLSSDKLVGSFRAYADVRNEVTDSAVAEILHELRRINNENVTIDELQLTKNQMNGSFARSLESPQTIARFALNTAMYNLPEDYYQNYLKMLSLVTVPDVNEVAKKYIRPDNAYIVIVGNKEEIAPKLKQFNKTADIAYYNVDGELVGAESLKKAPAGVTAQKVVEDYIKAIGGADKLKKVNDITYNMSTSMQGMTINMTMKQKRPDKYLMEVSSNGMVLQKQVYDGKRGKMSGMQGEQEITGDDLEGMKEAAQIHGELKYLTPEYKLDLKGIEKVGGVEAYKVVITNPEGDKKTEYFAVDSGLRIKSIESQDTPMGPVTQTSEFGNYKEVNGVKYPYTIKTTVGPQVLDMKVESVEVNKGIKDDVFTVK